MVFTQPSWSPRLGEVPDVSLHDFMFNEKYGRASLDSSLPPYVCSNSGIAISARGLKDRVEILANGLAHELQWGVNHGLELDKVVGIFALNTIDLPALTWAVHRLNGVCAPINAAFTEWELAQQLRKTNAKVLFTTATLLEVAEKAAKACGIPKHNIYICDTYDAQGPNKIEGFTHISDLLEKGNSVPTIEPIQWSPGQSKKQVAFLSHSSGTSGPPKVAMVSHQNIIANILQLTSFEEKGRGGPQARQIVLGVLPHSHIYGVVVISHLSTYRGDSIIVLPKFDMHNMLDSIVKYKIQALNIVPPIIVSLSKSPDLLKKYDLSSVKSVVSGGAPLTEETIQRLHAHYPGWVIRQAYGLTESAACACMTSAHDPCAGSSGSVIPGVEVKIVDKSGDEVTSCDELGEILIKSPSVILGYLGDEKATQDTIFNDSQGRWLQSGDIGYFGKSPLGNEHIFIVDRKKELIKVKGYQVVPAELEDMLLSHPAVAECAVVGVKDARAGELPRAYVQRSSDFMAQSDDELAEELQSLVKARKAKFKWLRGGIVFVESIPKSPSGKTLRRLLRSQEATQNGPTSKL